MANSQGRSKENTETNHVSDEQEKFNIELKNIHNILNGIEKKLDETLENTRILKRQADAILRQTFELAEFTLPRLFIVLPDDTPYYNPAHWFHLNYRLYFLCECERDDEQHFAFHEGYEIKQPREFLQKYGPYLRKMLTVVKCVVTAGRLTVPLLPCIVPVMSDSVIPRSAVYWYNLENRIERLGEILTEAEKSLSISTVKNIQYVEGAELRQIRPFLKKVDAHHTLGNLFRSVTNDGHVRWVCIQHYEKLYSERVIKGLHEEFRHLGGEIKEHVAIIPGETSKKFSEMLDVLKKGLPVFSVVLKDLNVQLCDFDKLFSDVLKQSVIYNLELDNITVSYFGHSIKKQEIILKLEDAVRKNDKLTIQYSFTKPLSNFASKTIYAIRESKSRLTFRVRSREDTPWLELVGTNETGFTLSINNSNEKSNVSYHTAIINVFQIIPNINKILLHNGVISESIWTSFCELLTTSQTLQDLTIDCHLTIEQTKKLSVSLSDNRTLKTLQMFHILKPNDEFDGFEEIFQILHKNAVLIEFNLACYTDLLQLDSIAKCLLQNKCLRIVRLPKCEIHQHTDIELCERFLRNTFIRTLSLELIGTNYEASFERLARALDKNETIETLELKGSDSSAIFHRDNRKSVSVEPFYALCNYPSFYKQMQEIAQNFKLEELQVTIGEHVEMTDVPLCIERNCTVTELRINKRIVTVKDIQMLVEALRNNTTITHLKLNEINISMNYFRQMFDVLRDDRTLRVLDVSHCISHSDRDLFIEQIKTLQINNPSLKILHENQ